MGSSADAGSKNGLEIWRIEKMDVAPVAKETYGTFYSGDCYIVLRTHDVKGRKVQDLHFWLGNNSSQDEAGAAALKTVELDQMLGDLPTQYREVQGSESDAFLGLFRNGI
jgi:gelsolin